MKNEIKLTALSQQPDPVRSSNVATAVRVSSTVKTDVPVCIPKDTVRHILRSYTLSHVEPYINKQMLLGHHLGVKGTIEKLLAAGDEKAVKIQEMVNQLIHGCKREKIGFTSCSLPILPCTSLKRIKFSFTIQITR